jgi:4'-phosphopantetheinyl transferase
VILTDGEIHVWRIDFRADDGVDDRVLSADERARAAQFRFDEHRRRYVHARSALRMLLAGYLSAAPESFVFAYDRYGKPSVDGGVHFNVAHSGDVAMAAFSRSCSPGVDVERVRPLDDLELLAARVMSPSELARFHALEPEARTRAFFFLWTRKEAVLKAQGVGLSGSMPAIEVSLDCDQTLATDRSGASWRIWPLDAGDEYEASLAAAAEPEAHVVERVWGRG